MLLFQSGKILDDLNKNSNLKDVVELADEIRTSKAAYQIAAEESCCLEQALELAPNCTDEGRSNECLFSVGGFKSVSPPLSSVYRG